MDGTIYLRSGIKQTTDNSKIKTLSNSIEKQNKKLSTLQTQINNIYDLLEQGVYDIETFTDRSASLKQQISDLKKSINILEKKLKTEKQINEAHDLLIPRINNLLESYETMETAGEKNNALQSVLDKVIYTKTVRRKKGETQDTFEITIYPKVPHH